MKRLTNLLIKAKFIKLCFYYCRVLDTLYLRSIEEQFKVVSMFQAEKQKRICHKIFGRGKILESYTDFFIIQFEKLDTPRAIQRNSKALFV